MRLLIFILNNIFMATVLKNYWFLTHSRFFNRSDIIFLLKQLLSNVFFEFQHGSLTLWDNNRQSWRVKTLSSIFSINSNGKLYIIFNLDTVINAHSILFSGGFSLILILEVRNVQFTPLKTKIYFETYLNRR